MHNIILHYMYEKAMLACIKQFKKSTIFISLRNFNQLDATSKVMYRHEIIYTGNKAYLIN